MKSPAPLVPVLLGLLAIVAFIMVLDVISPPGRTLGTALATGGTALGTLGLALYTYQLAKSTRQAVEDGDKQLEQIRRQVDATTQMAEASKAQVDQAFKSRTDTYSPLVGIRAEIVQAQYIVDNGVMAFVRDAEVREEQPGDYPLSVVLRFTLQNYGKSPAMLTFSGLAESMDNIAAAQSKVVILEPSEYYLDTLTVIIEPTEFAVGHSVKMVVTCGGLLHGEMSDEVHWNAIVRPYAPKGDGRLITVGSRDMIHTAGSQILREYPNLERPEDMRAARARLRGESN